MKKKVLFPILAVVLALSLALPMATVVGAAVTSTGTDGPAIPTGRVLIYDNDPDNPAAYATPVIVTDLTVVDLTLNQYENSDEVRVFNEKQGFTLTGALAIDEGFGDFAGKSSIPVDYVVNSHLIHQEPIQENSRDAMRGVGSIEFDGDIIAVIVEDEQLDASDYLGNDDVVAYPTGLNLRGLETYTAIPWQDLYEVSGNVIKVDLQSAEVMDQMRIITEPIEEPFTTNLCAGQDIDIGNVIVEDDGTTLFVTYEITVPGWLITETHVEVVEEAPADFPTTKKGNPKVGKFTWSEDHNPPVETYTQEIPLDDIGEGVTAGDVYIAAHAAVIKVEGDCQDPFWATNYTSDNQGDGWDNGGNPVPVTGDRSDPMAVTGQPDAYSSPYGIGFFSLGEGGDITVGFGYPIFNGAGDYDISVHEISGNRGDPTEDAEVYVIVNGDEYFAGYVSSSDQGNGIGTISIPAQFIYVDAVRIVDTTDKALHIPTYNGDGYDLDAVDACYLIVQEETAWGGACDEENYRTDQNPEGFVIFFNPDGKGNWASFFVYEIK